MAVGKWTEMVGKASNDQVLARVCDNRSIFSRVQTGDRHTATWTLKYRRGCHRVGVLQSFVVLVGEPKMSWSFHSNILRRINKIHIFKHSKLETNSV